MTGLLEGFTPWPADVADEYRRQGYWRGVDLGSLLRSWAERYGDRVALVHEGIRVTYTELDAWADRMAAGFLAHGIRPGERLLFQLPNVPEFAAAFFGLLRAGVHPVFALPAHRATELRHLAEAADAVGYVGPHTHLGFDHADVVRGLAAEMPALRHLFVHGAADGFTSLADVGRAAPVELPEVNPSNVAFFLLSGGTTALPKLVPRTHDDYEYQIRASAAACGVSGADTFLAALPAQFNFCLGAPGWMATLNVGGTVVFAEEATADVCFELIERERVTFTAVVPTVAKMWLDEVEWSDHDLSTLRFLLIGGAPLSPELARQVRPGLGCVLTQVFGMAEGLLLYSAESDDEETRTTTQGRPLSPADEVRIVDDEGDDVPDGTSGHLLARGPYTIRGYFAAAEHNATAFVDGFYRTGDVVRRTPDGSLVVTGRAKDVIIRGGNKISPAEIEGHLLTHPGVRQAAVVGMPDEYLGERTCAFVVPSDEPATAADLKRALHDTGLADYKLPDRFEFIDELPLTPLRKIDRKELRARISGLVAGRA